MTKYTITLTVETDADPSDVLDAAIESLPSLVHAIEGASGERCEADDDDVSVSEAV